MRSFLLFTLLQCAAFVAFSQNYADSLAAHRQHYKAEFLEDKRSPLKAEDTAYLRFYDVDPSWRVVATVVRTPESAPFTMQTYSGKTRQYRKFADLHFRLKKKSYKLEVYQSMDLIQKEEYKDHLFIPFRDLTNYETTYGGGRYLDLSLKDIHNDLVILDFNKAYNPWCAFAEGYSCPIPPDPNKLNLAVKAGERLFGREPKH
jgi:uncharacterized protein (DUF1684 family)